MLLFLMHHSAEVGLVLFLVSFLMILFIAMTRTQTELDAWASLPLAVTSDALPRQPEATS